MLILQSLQLLYRNNARGLRLSRAYIAQEGDAIKIRLAPSRPVSVEAGQYIGLCIPAAGYFAFQQLHPFTVVSWSEGNQDHLDFLLEPRKGITRELMRLARANVESRRTGEDDDIVTRHLQPHIAWYSGPHGSSVPVGDYESIIMIASDFGIVSQLPYLLQLIHDYKHRKARNRRIHLVWQLGTKS